MRPVPVSESGKDTAPGEGSASITITVALTFRFGRIRVKQTAPGRAYNHRSTDVGLSASELIIKQA